jgi:hypothetical protein
MSLNDGMKIGPVVGILIAFIVVVVIYFAWVGAQLTARVYQSGW